MSDQTANSVEPLMPRRESGFKRTLKGLALMRESPVGMFGLFLVLFWVVMAILAPILPLYPPNEILVPLQKIGAVAPDGGTFWLGTDHKGRDILSRLIWGAQKVLIWATFATFVAYVIGMLMGVAAGYLGGWADEIVSFIANIFLSFPFIILCIIIVAQLGASGFTIVIAVTFASAPQIMRIVRGLVLDIQTRDYVAALAPFIGVSVAAERRQESAVLTVDWRAAPLFTAPEGDADDLTKIKGIGPVAKRQLAEQGITQFAQVAALSDEDIVKIDEAMPFSADQIKDWREQAREMAK